MKLSPKQRWTFLGIMLVSTLMAVVFASQPEREVKVTKTAVKAFPAPGKTSMTDSMIPLEKLKRPVARTNAINVLASKTWHVPPPPPKALPPPPPSAPPMPFTYMGKLVDGPDHMIIFLVKGEQVYTVRSGDVIDAIYRVDGVSAGLLTMTYLPLDIKQTINVGNDS
jgi:hypothetical protein